MSSKTWRFVATIGTFLVGVAALASHFALQSIFEAASAFAVLAMLVGLRHYRPQHQDPWFGFIGAVGLFGLSFGLRMSFHSMLPAPDGAVTPPDVIDSFAYLLAIASVHRLGQVRDGDRERTTIVDALILTGGVSTILWIGTILPYIEETDIVLSGKILGVILAVFSIWLAFAAMRLTIGPGAKSGTSRLLAISACFAMFAEIAVTESFAAAESNFALAFGAIAMLFTGVAALHPSMAKLTEPTKRDVANVTRQRLAAMTVAVAVAPAAMLIEVGVHGGNLVPYTGLVVCWIIVMSLVVARFVGLVRVREQIASVERALSRAAASLVTATDRDETYRSALTAMTELTGTQYGATRASVALAFADEWRVVGSLGFGSEVANGRQLDSLTMKSTVPSSPNSPIQLLNSVAFDNPTTGLCSTVLAPLISHGEVRGTLLMSTALPLPLILVEALGALASDVSLAVEAASLAEDLHLRRSEQHFRALVENSPDIILVVNESGVVTFASPVAERLLDKERHNWAAFLESVHNEDTAAVEDLVRNASHNGFTSEFRMIDGNEVRWFEATSNDLTGESEINGIVINARDISERKAAEAERDLREARFRSLVQHSSDITIVLDHNGVITYITPAVEHMLGYAATELMGTALTSIVHNDDQKIISELASLLIGGNAVTRHVELRVLTVDGDVKTLDVTLTDLRADPSVNGIVMNAHDITDRKTLEHDLRHKVLHDDLTGIANRVLFRDRVDHALQMRPSVDTVTAVLFIDIDDFKTINDGLGHDAGDEFLKIVAFRLESFFRAGDTAARLGGDEFAVLVEGLASVEDTVAAAHRLLKALNEPIQFEHVEVNVNASIGVAMIEAEVTSEELLRNADVAMYHAKQTGKNRVKLFDQAMYVSAFERLELKADLVHALERNELSLHYQPLVKMDTGELVGFEALMRWIHPTRGFVSPASFIPLAEETGLIVPIGAWALTTALTQLAQWRSVYGRAVGMSVNVSPRQLEDEDIVKHVEDALRISGAQPSWVTLELTESAGLDDATRQDRLIRLRDLGCQIAADDFGTGFASYAALQQLPFTNVKIDRSLIIGLSDGDTKAHAQVRSIIQMGHALGLTITAEGIEDSRQADALVVLGADKGQGYLFGRPAPAHETEELFRNSPVNADDPL